MEKFIQENSFKQKREKARLKFNPGLTLIGLRTTGPRFLFLFIKGTLLDNFLYFFSISNHQMVGKEK